MEWSKVKTVRYWFSPTQGGVDLSDGTRRIRICRWIGNYPRFVALLHHKLPQDCFPATASLPVDVFMNERSKTAWLVFGLIAGTAPCLAYDGYTIMAVMTAVSALLTGAVFAFGSSRTLHITRDEIRDIQRVVFNRRTIVYPRHELSDVRMGRQLTAGGLWLKFGNRRLEIGNLDSKIAPEEIFRLLKKDWRWENPVQPQSEVGQKEASRAV